MNQHDINPTVTFTIFLKCRRDPVSWWEDGDWGREERLEGHSNRDDDEDSLWCWNWKSESVANMYSVCQVDGGLLVTGGLKHWEFTVHDQCRLYELGTKEWAGMPPLINARYSHNSVSVGGCVCELGGKGIHCTEPTVLASVECLNLKRQQWSSLSEMTKDVCRPMTVMHGSNISAIGGCNEWNFNKSAITDHATTENNTIAWEGAKTLTKSQTQEHGK